MNTMKPVGGGNSPDFRRRGQTFAEFAISLPILLLLLFGVLEFGRLFQSWVTLQNAVRTAARYAVTGLYNEDKYDLDLMVPCYAFDSNFQAPGSTSVPVFGGGSKGVTVYNPQPDLLPPSNDFDVVVVSNALLNAGSGQSGNRAIIFNGQARRAYEDLYSGSTRVLKRGAPFTQEAVNALSGQSVKVFALNPDESLYATWYGRDQAENDCFPTDDALQDRKDLLRMATIYDEARRGAAGLALDASLTGNGSRAEFVNFLRNFWSNPSPGQDSRAWFNVTICSAREKRYPDGVTDVVDNDNGSSARFETFTGEGVAYAGAPAMPGGACLLKEKPDATNATTAPFMIDNYNQSWGDPGDAGDRISLIITYNHPLITPLGLARYVQIQARRSAVNESFKVTSAERVIGSTGDLPSEFVSPTPQPPSETPPPPSETPVPPTSTGTPLPTATETPSPFDCDKISAGGMYFDIDGRSVVVTFTNDNAQATEFTHAVVVWPTGKILGSPAAPKYPTAYFAFSSVEQDVHWVGNSPDPAAPFADTSAANITPIDTLTNARGTFYDTAYREVQGFSDTIWKGTFLDVGQRLGEFIGLYDFSGSVFYFADIARPGQECAITLETPPPPPSPTSPPPGWTASATHTPDCADNRLTMSFVSFQSLGDVQFRVTNNRPIPGYLIGFQIRWPNDIPGIRLSRVVVGGNHANDIADPVTNPGGQGRVVWQNLSGGATASPTYSHQASTGTWLANYVFPPNSVTNVWMDFTGSGVSSLAALGAHASDFNGTLFRILCTPPTAGQGGPGGPGGQQQGDIGPSNVNTPQPTNPPPPTVTPGPTLTPSKTPTKAPPTATWTKGPPTSTPRPSATARASNTPTPRPSPTDVDMGNSDGG